MSGKMKMEIFIDTTDMKMQAVAITKSVKSPDQMAVWNLSIEKENPQVPSLSLISTPPVLPPALDQTTDIITLFINPSNYKSIESLSLNNSYLSLF